MNQRVQGSTSEISSIEQWRLAIGDVQADRRNADDPGLGLYRAHYLRHGADFWGWQPGSAVQWFSDTYGLASGSRCLDLGAGTGKNAVELLRLGAGHVVAVEIDAIAVRILLDAVINLEGSGLVPEGRVSIQLDNALRYLEHTTEQFDVVVSYGLAHVFKDLGLQRTFVEGLMHTVAPGGHLILQTLTDRYPAPAIQPELEGVTVTDSFIEKNFPTTEWAVLYLNKDDIEHSHSGSDVQHRHGSIRSVLKRVPAVAMQTEDADETR